MNTKTNKTAKSANWTVITYGVWGNEEDGFDVNDTFKVGVRELSFDAGDITDAEIADVFGITGDFETDGDDAIIYVTADNGYPIGELRREEEEDNNE